MDQSFPANDSFFSVTPFPDDSKVLEYLPDSYNLPLPGLLPTQLKQSSNRKSVIKKFEQIGLKKKGYFWSEQLRYILTLEYTATASWILYNFIHSSSYHNRQIVLFALLSDFPPYSPKKQKNPAHYFAEGSVLLY